MSNKKSLSVKTVSILLVLVLLVGLAAGGTIAWLIDASEQVVNTFTYGDINIDLDETDTNLDGDNNPNTNEYEMIPGKDLTKDPIVTVEPTSEAHWLFVKLEEKGGDVTVGEKTYSFKDFLTYQVAAPWAPLDSTNYPGVYYIDVDAATADAGIKYPVLEGNKVSVLTGVTKEMVNALDAGEEKYPQLAITAYAVQREGFEIASDAWKEAMNVAPDASPEYTYVDTAAELQTAIENPDVKNIFIDGDLTYDWGSESYANSKALLMQGKTFVGRGADSSITFKGYGSANPIVGVTLENLTVKDETVGDNEGAWEHGHLEFDGLTAEDVYFANSIMVTGDSSLTNCEFNNPIASWYGAWVEGGNAEFTNCVFTGTRAIKIHEAYGTEVESVAVTGCKFTLSEKPGVVIGDVNAATEVVIKNSTFATQAGDQGLYIYETDTAVGTFAFAESGNTVQ